MSHRGLNGVRALVTGAASGIGAAMARELASVQARMVLTDRRGDDLFSVAETCRNLGGEVEVVIGDLTEPTIRQQLAENTMTALGGLDLLANVAGITMNSLFTDLDERVLRHIFEVNFFAPAALTAKLLPSLMTSRGRIVVISSITGLVGVPTRSAYAASKRALHGLFDSMRIELRGQGVSITMVCPGYVDTSLRARALLGNGREQGHDQAAGKRMLSPGFVAKSALAGAARRKRMVLLGMETRFARTIGAVFPDFLDAVLARQTR